MTTTTAFDKRYQASPPGIAYNDISSPFTMDECTFEHLAFRIVEIAKNYRATMDDRPAYVPMPPEARELLQHMALPESGIQGGAILDFYLQYISPSQRGQDVPTFAGFVDPGGSDVGKLAACMAAFQNNSNTGGNYAAAYLEQTAVRWLMELIGYPTQESAGVFLHGGSDANRHGIEVARHWGAMQNGWNVRDTAGLVGHQRMVMYVTPEAHSCIYKAAFTLGLGAPHEVPIGQDFRMDVEALREAIAQDRAAGYCPFLVVASAGTVRTGAIDPLNEIADVCAAENLWMHVDGAFGGFGAVDPRLAPLYRGIERADSLAIDPHKWLTAPISCSCVFVKNGQLLTATYKLVPDYLRFSSGNVFADGPWYSHRSAAQTRDFAPALKTFWIIQAAGRQGIIAHVSRHIDLAHYMANLIEASPDLELVATGPLPAVCFRYAPEELLRGCDEELNTLNQTLMGRLQVAGRAFLAGVEFALDEGSELVGPEASEERVVRVFALRSCAMHYALTEEHVKTILNEVRRVGQLCLEEMH